MAITSNLGIARVPIAITRQKTSRQRLRLAWEYPVYRQELPDGPPDRTVAVAASKPLDRGKAFAYVAGEDLRPLLVLRECENCVGTDVALLNRTRANDRSLLLAQWFHCVKLPNDVLRKDHPFRNLFDVKKPAHLFLATRDGSLVLPLSGAQSQGDLWRAMLTVLREAYASNPDRAVRQHLKLLAAFDHLDSREDLLLRQIDQKVEKFGPDHYRVRALQREIAEIRAKKQATLEEERKVVALPLKKT